MGNHSAQTGRRRSTEARGLIVRHFPNRSPQQYVRKLANGARAFAATDLPDWYGEHWRRHGDPDSDGFAEVVEAEFLAEHWHPEPESNAALVFDPAPLDAEAE